MQLTEQHEALRESLSRFVDQEINRYVDEWEAAEEYPTREVMKKAGDAGFLGISKPTEYGGMGLDYSYSMIWAEQLGHIRSGSVGSSLGAQTDMATPALAKNGSDELRREFLAPAIAGDMVTCIGVSETGAGSDVASIKTYARKDGDDYVISGGKMWTTNGNKADWMCLLANTSEEGAPHKNKSLIVLPLNTKGVERTPPLNKFGLRAVDTTQIFFDDVRVPQRYRIGEEGRGFIYQMEQFIEERLFAAARTVSQMQDCIDDTAAYTRDRVAFGKPLLDNQWIHYTLADLTMEIASLRALTEKAVDGYVNGKDVRLLTSMAKLKSGKLARTVPDQCMQFMGGAGYLWENRVTRMLRDSRLVAIGGGANEVMMGIIAKELGYVGRKA